MHQLHTTEVFAGDTLGADQLKSRYDIYADRMEVYDIVWGDAVFDHQIFSDLARHDALRRLQSVEQLTLPDRYKTIPGTSYFSRWEHAWGSAIFAGQLGKQMGLEKRETVKMQLRALLSDVCHTAHSHAGDWIVQGVGNGESLHDERRLDYAEAIGINEILRRYGYDPAEILDDKKDGIIDAPMPDLDVDRIDYTLRESYRWVQQIPEYRALLNKNSFEVRDGRVVCKNKTAAKLLGVSYVLLVTEHWQEPAHRLQLELFMESMKRTMVARSGRREEAGTYSPLDFLMVTDDTLYRLADDNDRYLPITHELMRGVSESETNNRWRARADRVHAALSTAIGRRSQSIEWIVAHYDTLPRSYEIEKASGSKLRNTQYITTLPLPKLRRRTIDPYFIDDDGEVKRLSEEDPAYRIYEQEAMANVRADWKAGIVGNRITTAALKACLEENRSLWPSVMRRPRMPNAVLRELIRETVCTSNPAASRAVEVNLH